MVRSGSYPRLAPTFEGDLEVIDNSRLEVLAKELLHFPVNQRTRMQFFNAFLDSELCLLLREEAGKKTISPIVACCNGIKHVLVFNSEDNLAEYSKKVVPYAALSGRVIVDMLARANLGVTFNFAMPSKELVLTAGEITWLNEIVAETPYTHEARPKVFFPLGEGSVKLNSILIEKLLSAAELATSFWLVGVEYDDQSQGVLLIIIDARKGAEAPLAKAAMEAVALSGLESLPFDVSFLRGQEKLVETVKRQGRPLVFPERPAKTLSLRSIPGGDPSKPPKLR